MQTINLKKYYYPLFATDTFIEVSDEVAEALEKCGFDLALGTLAHQWTADAASLEELQRAVVDGVGR